MWPFDEELEVWFEEVERLREEKYGRSDEKPIGDMMENDFARERRG